MEQKDQTTGERLSVAPVRPPLVRFYFPRQVCGSCDLRDVTGWYLYVGLPVSRVTVGSDYVNKNVSRYDVEYLLRKHRRQRPCP